MKFLILNEFVYNVKELKFVDSFTRKRKGKVCFVNVFHFYDLDKICVVSEGNGDFYFEFLQFMHRNDIKCFWWGGLEIYSYTPEFD